MGKRSQWPLGRLATTEQFRSGYLLVGNAAHTLHPVAGQGLNLTMREADMLAGLWLMQFRMVSQSGAG